MFRGSVKSTGYPLHLPVSPSLPLPCLTVCHHVSTGVYIRNFLCLQDMLLVQTPTICLRVSIHTYIYIYIYLSIYLFIHESTVLVGLGLLRNDLRLHSFIHSLLGFLWTSDRLVTVPYKKSNTNKGKTSTLPAGYEPVIPAIRGHMFTS
jgi:hypothetical protein